MTNLARSLAVCFCLLISTSAWAQSTAQISGTVKDQCGAVLPGAEVTVTQTDTDLKRTAIIDETGGYILKPIQEEY